MADIKLRKINVTAKATVIDAQDAICLDGYPLLACSRSQWGEGVRTEDNGTLVADIAAAATDTPDHEALAARFKTTTAHIGDAIRYAAQEDVTWPNSPSEP